MSAAPRNDAYQTRLAATVMAVTAVLWVAANWAGRQFGWPAHYAFLFDLAAIAGFVWSLLVAWRIWRRRNDTGSSTTPPGNKGK